MQKIKVWIFELFEYYQGFRRSIAIYVLWFTFFVTTNSFSIITLAIVYDRDLLQLTGLLTTVYGLTYALIGYISKLYWDGRKNDSNT